jgi:hypothetical protein
MEHPTDATRSQEATEAHSGPDTGKAAIRTAATALVEEMRQARTVGALADLLPEFNALAEAFHRNGDEQRGGALRTVSGALTVLRDALAVGNGPLVDRAVDNATDALVLGTALFDALHE